MKKLAATIVLALALVVAPAATASEPTMAAPEGAIQAPAP